MHHAFYFYVVVHAMSYLMPIHLGELKVYYHMAAVFPLAAAWRES